MSDLPLLLLDVDGVLNALTGAASDLTHWSNWEQGWATADGQTWPILFAPQVVAELVAWHDSGRVDMQWLTTWGREANGELKELLGMPELAVAGTYRDDDAGAEVETAAPSHAGMAPSAPDPLSGRWWKYDVVRRLVERDPGRLVIWVDDELHDDDSQFRSSPVGTGSSSWGQTQRRDSGVPTWIKSPRPSACAERGIQPPLGDNERRDALPRRGGRPAHPEAG